MRRPAVNLGGPSAFNNYYYYETERPYHREWELDRKDAESRKKYCQLCNILLVYDRKHERFICGKCGWYEGCTDQEKEEGGYEKSSSDKHLDVLETSTHLRTAPGGKSDTPVKVFQSSAESIMAIESIPNQSIRGHMAKNKIIIEDPEINRLKAKGYSLISEQDYTQQIGTMSTEESRKQKARRLL